MDVKEEDLPAAAVSLFYRLLRWQFAATAARPERLRWCRRRWRRQRRSCSTRRAP